MEATKNEPKTTMLTDAEIEARVHQLRELNRLKDEVEAEIEFIKDELKAHMTATGADELCGASFKITWKPVDSMRLDSKALKARMPEVFNRFAKLSSSMRFNLT